MFCALAYGTRSKDFPRTSIHVAQVRMPSHISRSLCYLRLPPTVHRWLSSLVKKMQFNVVHVLAPPLHGLYGYREVLETVHSGLTALGHDATLSENVVDRSEEHT